MQHVTGTYPHLNPTGYPTYPHLNPTGYPTNSTLTNSAPSNLQSRRFINMFYPRWNLDLDLSRLSEPRSSPYRQNAAHPSQAEIQHIAPDEASNEDTSTNGTMEHGITGRYTYLNATGGYPTNFQHIAPDEASNEDTSTNGTLEHDITGRDAYLNATGTNSAPSNLQSRDSTNMFYPGWNLDLDPSQLSEPRSSPYRQSADHPSQAEIQHIALDEATKKAIDELEDPTWSARKLAEFCQDPTCMGELNTLLSQVKIAQKKVPIVLVEPFSESPESPAPTQAADTGYFQILHEYTNSAEYEQWAAYEEQRYEVYNDPQNAFKMAARQISDLERGVWGGPNVREDEVGKSSESGSFAAEQNDEVRTSSELVPSEETEQTSVNEKDVSGDGEKDFAGVPIEWLPVLVPSSMNRWDE